MTEQDKTYSIDELSGLKSLLPLAYEYHSLGVIPYKFNETHWLNQWTELLASGAGKIWAHNAPCGAPCSALGGVLSHDFSAGDLVFGECFFFSSTASYGGGLWIFKKAEKDLEDLGVKRMYFHSRLNFKPERVAKFYSYMGFQPNEIQWVKEI